jgi:hypothetical protein
LRDSPIVLVDAETGDEVEPVERSTSTFGP